MAGQQATVWAVTIVCAKHGTLSGLLLLLSLVLWPSRAPGHQCLFSYQARVVKQPGMRLVFISTKFSSLGSRLATTWFIVSTTVEEFIMLSNNRATKPNLAASQPKS